ncbi:hypothetical protein RSJ42_11730 [Methanosarcina hadiensis]|uniref:hypothetical protein n=1 Tax=Methanosarcina hadiensis TaxID=3078083 RepID=UPI00397735FD
MDEPAFYFCARNFIDRIGCMPKIECPGIRDESYEEKRSQATKSVRVNPFPGSSPLSLFLVEQNNLNKEEVNLLKRHWEMFKKSFPIAGILYSYGRPSIFCAKVTDFMDEKDFKFLYENIHQSFLYFADKHFLSVFQTGQCTLTLCFGFRDPESLEAAKRFIGHSGHNMHLFKRTFAETWLVDLNTLEIISGSNILIKAGQSIGQTITETADEFLNKNKVSHSDGVSLSPDSLNSPSSFILYAQAFNAGIEKGTVTVPDDWIDRFRPECINLKILSHKNKIKKVESRKEEYERKTGESVLSRYRAGFTFGDFDIEIETALKKQKYLDTIEENICLVKKMRFEWGESRKRVRELREAFKKLDQEYKNSYYRLTKTLFEQEPEAVITDPELKRIFSNVLHIRSEIDKRKKEISELQSEKTGFVGRVKNKIKIIYLTGVNRAEDWNKDKKWAEMGEQIVNSCSSAAFLSSSGPIIKAIEKEKIKKKGLNAEYAQEMNRQNRIKNQIKNMSEGAEYSYPWLELEEELIEKARISKHELSILLSSLGKSFRKIPQKYQDSDLQILDEGIRACESHIAQINNEIDGLKEELSKLTNAQAELNKLTNSQPKLRNLPILNQS